MARVKYVISNRYDGLGGRIVNLLLSICLARKIKADLLIHWPGNWAISSDALGYLLNEPMIARLGKAEGGCRIDWQEIGCMNDVKSIRLISHSDRLEPDDLERFDAIALRNINPEAIAVFDGYTKQAVRDDCRAIFSGLKLNAQVERMLGRFDRENDLSNAVAVHVRRGDLIGNPNAIHRERAIELDEYFTALEKHPRCQIFLATDSRDVIRAFRKNFGNRVLSARAGIFSLSGFSRQSRRDVQYAFHELLLLSRCKTIIAGPSNFSTAAALLGGNELQLLLNKNMSQPWEEIRAIWGL